MGSSLGLVLFVEEIERDVDERFVRVRVVCVRVVCVVRDGWPERPET
jgi:hypothetical protein